MPQRLNWWSHEVAFNDQETREALVHWVHQQCKTESRYMEGIFRGGKVFYDSGATSLVKLYFAPECGTRVTYTYVLGADEIKAALALACADKDAETIEAKVVFEKVMNGDRIDKDGPSGGVTASAKLSFTYPGDDS